jgi:hypothetical protein
VQRRRHFGIATGSTNYAHRQRISRWLLWALAQISVGAATSMKVAADQKRVTMARRSPMRSAQLADITNANY